VFDSPAEWAPRFCIYQLFRTAVARVGRCDEWHLDFPRSFQHLTFDLAPRLPEEGIVLRPPPSQARFKPVRSVGHSVSRDGIEYLSVEQPAKSRISFREHRDHRKRTVRPVLPVEAGRVP